MNLSLGFEWETRTASFCLINESGTLYNDPYSKPKTLLLETENTKIKVSADFIDEITTHTQDSSTDLSTVKNVWVRQAIKFINTHQEPRYTINMEDGRVFYIKNTSQNYSIKNVFRDAEFDILFKCQSPSLQIHKIKPYLFSKVGESIRILAPFMFQHYQCVRILNQDFPYSWAILPNGNPTTPHLFLSRSPLADFARFPFCVQVTLGFPITGSRLLFPQLELIYRSSTGSTGFHTLFEKVGSESRDIFTRISGKIPESDQKLVFNYLYLFLYSYHSFFNGDHQIRKYKSLLLIRHNFYNLQTLLPPGVIPILSDVLSTKPQIQQYFDLIHGSVSFSALQQQQATHRQHNQSITLFSVGENNIFVEYRGFSKVLKKDCGGSTMERYLALSS